MLATGLPRAWGAQHAWLPGAVGALERQPLRPTWWAAPWEAVSPESEGLREALAIIAAAGRGVCPTFTDSSRSAFGT